MIVLLPVGDTKRKDDVDYDRVFGESLKKNNGGDTRQMATLIMIVPVVKEKSEGIGKTTLGGVAWVGACVCHCLLAGAVLCQVPRPVDRGGKPLSYVTIVSRSL